MNINFRGLGLTNSRKTKLEILAILLCIITTFIFYCFPDRLGPTINEFLELFQQPVKLESYYSTHKPPHHRAFRTLARDHSLIGLSSQLSKLKRALLLEDATLEGARRINELTNYNINSQNYPTQSLFTNIEDLTNYGWRQFPFTVAAPAPHSEFGYVLSDLGLSVNRADWVVANDVHSNHYSIPHVREQFLATYAHFTSLINPNQGSIIIINTLSPRETEKFRRGIPAPPLEKLSDNLFLNWIRTVGSDANRVAGLKYYLCPLISDSDTEGIIRDIERRTDIGEWPGTDFLLSDTEIDSDGRALLGTPASAPIVDLLPEHKAYFPRKYISKITIFKTDDGQGTYGHYGQLLYGSFKSNMIFYIDELPDSATSQHPGSPPLSPPGPPPPSPTGSPPSPSPHRSKWKCCFGGW